MIGPDSTLYEGGMFKAKLDFPVDFPSMPPSMTFTTKMWHPNIYPDGRVCISILHPPGDDEHNPQETADLRHASPAPLFAAGGGGGRRSLKKRRWRPVLGVESILMSVISMLSDPNDSSPANIDAAVQWREDPQAFKKQVRKLTRLSLEDF